MYSIRYNRWVRYAIVITLLVGIAILLSPFKVIAGVSAKPTLTLSYNNNDNANILSFSAELNKFAGFDFIIVSDNSSMKSCSISLDMETYRNLEQSRKTEIMEYSLSLVKESSMSTTTRNRIYNFIESQDESTSSLVRQLSNDVNADFADAYVIFKPFSGYVGTILGLFAIVVFVTLALMILVDLGYIVIPLIKDLLTPSSADAKPKLVSNEAWYAVKEADSVNDGSKNVLLIYLKKKSGQMVALSICILYLLSGQIYILIGDLMDLFRGILE